MAIDLVLTARREDRLKSVATSLEERYGVRVRTFPIDLGEPDGARRLIESLDADGVQIDALVNNAGYGVPGRYLRSSWETHYEFLRVMAVAVTELTHRLLPGMVERRFGRIINVASLAGLVPASAGHTLYGASKLFVIRFSEALALEVARPRRPRLRRVPGLYLQRVSRRERYAREGQSAAGVLVDGCRARGAGGVRGVRSGRRGLRARSGEPRHRHPLSPAARLPRQGGQQICRPLLSRRDLTSR